MDALTDANQFYNLSHAIYCCYGIDKKDRWFGRVLWMGWNSRVIGGKHYKAKARKTEKNWPLSLLGLVYLVLCMAERTSYRFLHRHQIILFH